jgi:hypothetical protein
MLPYGGYICSPHRKGHERDYTAATVGFHSYCDCLTVLENHFTVSENMAFPSVILEG